MIHLIRLVDEYRVLIMKINLLNHGQTITAAACLSLNESQNPPKLIIFGCNSTELPENIRLVRRGLKITNTVAYYSTELITAVKTIYDTGLVFVNLRDF